jgi:oligopeptide/dipeptide ABC transporter ATP-binding protein
LVSSPGEIVSGEIVLHNEDRDLVLTDLQEDGDAIRQIRGKEIAMIFQEPMTSLSPVHSVGSQIMEAVILHTEMRKAAAKAHAIRMMERVGIPNPQARFRQYPHEMSGGLRQRTVIAMALSCQPSLLIADEPTTALDVTIQAQILELMRDLQAELGMSILLITHDLGVVAEMADKVAVMYMGRVVEEADAVRLFNDPQHPYTQALLQSVPGREAQPGAKLRVISGSVPDPFQKIPGCTFHPRCEEAASGQCDQAPPLLFELSPGHKVACVMRQI